MQYPEYSYHATTPEAWELIKEQGLKSKYGFGYVYSTPDIEVAKKFGMVVIRIHLAKLDQSLLSHYHEKLCDILKTEDFINYQGDIAPEYLNIVT